ncbi:DUF6442 family protein [Paenibacillus sp. FSL R5-0912]
MVKFVLNRGRKFGVLGMLIIFSILAVYNLYDNHQVTNTALVL